MAELARQYRPNQTNFPIDRLDGMTLPEIVEYLTTEIAKVEKEGYTDVYYSDSGYLGATEIEGRGWLWPSFVEMAEDSK